MRIVVSRKAPSDTFSVSALTAGNVVCATVYLSLSSVGIDLKELGGRSAAGLKFCPGIEVYGRFSLKNERL